jgi:hypothetical protein
MLSWFDSRGRDGESRHHLAQSKQPRDSQGSFQDDRFMKWQSPEVLDLEVKLSMAKDD